MKKQGLCKAAGIFLLVILLAVPALAGNNSSAAFSIWPDTGQKICYDGTDEILCPAAGQPFYGQDAQSNGPVRSYTDLGNGIVQDNVTGLIWEQKTNMDGTSNYADPHDADNTYTWCDTNPATNGGYQGTCGSNDTIGFLNTLNSASFGGYNDWRLPTIKELASLVDLGRLYPAIDTIFTSTPAVFSEYWSSSSGSSTQSKWKIDFKYGDVGRMDSHFSNRVRAVRGGQTLSEDNRFIDNSDNTIIDSVTCLQWQKEPMDANHDGIPDNLTWQQSLAAAESLNLAGHRDWRLPDKRELITLVDYRYRYPALDPVFVATATSSSYLYWSSTTVSGATFTAWQVNYEEGSSSYSSKVNSLNPISMRAVRGGECDRSRPMVKDLRTTPSPVILGDEFNVNFEIAGATSATTTYEKVYVDLLREDGRLLFQCGEFSNIPILAGSSWNNHATCRIPAESLPGTYQVVLTGKKAGQPTVYFPTNAGVANPLEFTANVAPTIQWEPLTVSGKVIDNQENPIENALVQLCPTLSSDCLQTSSDSEGKFYLQHDRASASTTDWKLSASTSSCASGSGKDSVYLHSDWGTHAQSLKQDLQIQCSDGVKLPVIVVPGIFGSTLKNTLNICEGVIGSSGCYPSMGEVLRKNSDDYKILSPDVLTKYEYDVAGGRSLITALRQAGYPVKAMPWDWRIPTDEAAGRYLKKMIDQVKQEYGVDKVHVVAHSQGGLLARAYIQGLAKMKVSETSTVAYGYDISKLVMLGTPNGGSANPYWMVEGGDPLEIDSWELGGFSGWVAMFYSKTTNQLYRMRYKKDAIGFGLLNDYKISLNELVDFYHSEAPGALNLMARDNLLNCVSDCNLTNQGSSADFNGGVDPYRWLHEKLNIYNDEIEISLSNLGTLGQTGKVQTHLILSNSEDTIDRIDTKNNNLYNPEGLSWYEYKAVYKYGVPENVVRVPGDGTVAAERASRPLENVVTISTVAAGEHASLMKTMANCVVATLDTNETCTNTMLPAANKASYAASSQQTTSVNPSVHVAVNGAPQPQLINPSALATGVNASGTIEENIPNAELMLLGGNSSITVDTPVSGSYTLNLSSPLTGEYTIIISYVNETGKVYELTESGVHDAGEVTSLTFSLHPSGTDPLQMAPVIGTPGNLLAANSGGSVLLSWDAVAGASGYRVYSKRADMAEFSLLNTTSATQYQTNIPWDESGVGEQWFFYVVALTADGRIGLFDKSVDNRSLDKTGVGAKLTVAIQSLQVLAGLQPGGIDVLVSDINGDGKIGLEEAIDALKQASQQ